VKPSEDAITKGTAPGTEVDFEEDEDYFPLTLPSPPLGERGKSATDLMLYGS
jgi:hypothetical protein